MATKTSLLQSFTPADLTGRRTLVTGGGRVSVHHSGDSSYRGRRRRCHRQPRVGRRHCRCPAPECLLRLEGCGHPLHRIGGDRATEPGHPRQRRVPRHLRFGPTHGTFVAGLAKNDGGQPRRRLPDGQARRTRDGWRGQRRLDHHDGVGDRTAGTPLRALRRRQSRVINLTKTAALELRPASVRVNAICRIRREREALQPSAGGRPGGVLSRHRPPHRVPGIGRASAPEVRMWSTVAHRIAAVTVNIPRMSSIWSHSWTVVKY